MSTRTAPQRSATSVTEVVLQPGEYFVGDAGHRVRTVLGSCISVTLWCPRLRLGAMSHSLLGSRAVQGPRGPLPGGKRQAALDPRYGDEALALMLRELAGKGVTGPQCQAKIFGGGDMFAAHKPSLEGAFAIGRRNGEAARELLLAHGIDITSESLFGNGHRQIVFEIASGDVWARQLTPAGHLAAERVAGRRP